MADLKPCPFCGAEPSVEESGELLSEPFVWCPTLVKTDDGLVPCSSHRHTVDGWNTRADQPPVDREALVNALRSGEQADMDGCMVKVSRQACEEAADLIAAGYIRDPQRDARAQALIEEATDPDFIWGALDNVHDAETSLDDYAAAVSRAQRAALAALKGGQQ